MSTVGYGDIACTTTLGRIFMVFFILGALVLIIIRYYCAYAPCPPNGLMRTTLCPNSRLIVVGLKSVLIRSTSKLANQAVHLTDGWLISFEGGEGEKMSITVEADSLQKKMAVQELYNCDVLQS